MLVNWRQSVVRTNSLNPTSLPAHTAAAISVHHATIILVTTPPVEPVPVEPALVEPVPVEPVVILRACITVVVSRIHTLPRVVIESSRSPLLRGEDAK